MLALLSKLAPLIVLFLALAVAAAIAYIVYTIVTDVAGKTSDKMHEKNIHFNKDGMKIGVKEVNTENYVDQTQSLLVKAWNYSTWPAYKSRLWNKDAEEPSNCHARSSYSRSNSAAKVK